MLSIDFFTMKQLQLLAVIAVCKLSQVVSSGFACRKRGSISVRLGNQVFLKCLAVKINVQHLPRVQIQLLHHRLLPLYKRA
ncbi:hypothetical protein Fmac_020232 [Flemingia macrophylla]|uniref:Secreted protein n=1 Tax=Flemingia macrophylla TaxID=520843 RepID=A0ABD1LTE2_9FABA